MANEYDVVVIGGGPGGYVAAIRAAQLGLRTALVEKDAVGGICLNWGCIPSKALLKNAEIIGYLQRAQEFGISFDNLRLDMGKAIDRSRQVVTRLTKGVEFLLKKNKVDLIMGEAYVSASNKVEVKSDGTVLNTRNILIATGARSRNLPGITIDRQNVITSREALALRDAPKSIVIIGAGATGVEFGYFYRTYDSDVTILEMLPHALPLEDEEISKVLEGEFSKKGIKIKTGTKVDGVDVVNGKVSVRVSSEQGSETISCDKALVAIGVQGNSDGLGLEALGVAIERSFIKANDKMATNIPGIYAIGDVTGPPLLAHVASHKGKVAVEVMAGRETPRLDYEMMPRCTYCLPQVASMGITEAEARKRGIEVKVGRFPFRAIGKAIAMGETEGMIKLVSEAKSGDILGAHMIGPEVTELLAEVSLAKSLEATPHEIGVLVHAHPTLSQALMEAALDVGGEAIHI